MRRQAAAAVAGGARHALRGRQVRAGHDGRGVPALVPDAFSRGPLRRPVPPLVPAQRGAHLLHDAHRQAGRGAPQGVRCILDVGDWILDVVARVPRFQTTTLSVTIWQVTNTVQRISASRLHGRLDMGDAGHAQASGPARQHAAHLRHVHRRCRGAG